MAHGAFVGKERAAAYDGAHLALFGQPEIGLHTFQAVGTEAYVEHLHFAHEALVLSQEECQLGLPERQRERGAYDVLRVVVAIVFAHQPRRHVNAHHRGPALVDALSHKGKASAERLAQSGAEECVDDDIVGLQLREEQLGGHLDERGIGCLAQALAVGLAVGVQTAVHVEEVGRCDVSRFSEHASHGQPVAAIAARTGEDEKALSRSRPSPQQLVGHGAAGALHEVDGGYRFRLDCFEVQLAKLTSRKYLHSIKI